MPTTIRGKKIELTPAHLQEAARAGAQAKELSMNPRFPTARVYLFGWGSVGVRFSDVAEDEVDGEPCLSLIAYRAGRLIEGDAP